MSNNDDISIKMAHAKSNPLKMRAMMNASKGDLCDMMNLLTFVRLDYQDFKTVCAFKERDWLCFGAMREYEVGANRKPEDVPEHAVDDEDWADILTEEQFNKVKKGNPSQTLTHDLYIKMRNEMGDT